MKKPIAVYLTILIAVLSCSKKDSLSENTATSNETMYNGNKPITPLIEEEDARKRYSSKICYIVGDPQNLGTICEDPGTSCKKYDCTASSGNIVSRQLTETEINKYADIDADYLLKNGLIGKEDLTYFKNLSKSVLVERNKKFPTK